MSEKKSTIQRRKAKYNPADDPIHKRKYAILPCYKVTIPSRKKPVRVRCGAMIATRGHRLLYQQSKKEKSI